LVLGLLVASTKGAYDNQKAEVEQMAAKIAFLDRVLAIYGPETADSRRMLHHLVEDAIARMWPNSASRTPQLDPTASGQPLFVQLQQLAPQNDLQRGLKAQAVQLATDLGQMRWLT